MRKALLLAVLAAPLAAPLGALPAHAQQPAPAAAPTAAPAAAPAAAPTTPAGTTTPVHPPAATPEGAKRQKQVEAQLKSLHDKLKITPAQQKLWDDFAEARRDSADQDDQLFQQHPPATTETALDMLRDYAAMTKAYADHVQVVLPKFEALYDALTVDQKKVADKAFAERRQQMMQKH